MARRYLISGSVGSPYSRKIRSLMRYRQIPHEWREATGPGQAADGLPAPPLPLLPCVYVPRGESEWEATSDTSFILRRLEDDWKERSVLPTDPALALLDYLVEDYADEWVTKMMFHYRWGPQENVHNASKMLPLWNLTVPDSMLQTFAKTFAQRQIDRLSGVVAGSIEVTGPIIEDAYGRLLGILRDHFVTHKFLLGTRPGAADFALQGQLAQLVQVEPTSTARARAEAPRVLAWVDVVEDLSGLAVEGDAGWLARDALPDTYRALLDEIGRTYALFMLANAAALEAGADKLECTLDARPYWQKPFPYQGKCLRWLREEYAKLEAADRGFVDEVLAGTGCEVLFEA